MCGLSELVAYVEAGAHLDKLVGQDNTVTVAVGAGVPVAYHLSDVGVNEPQVFHQADERFALRFRPSVGGTAFLVQSAHVADTYASAVPARAMRSVEGDIPSRFDGSVQPDYEMIADGTETARTVRSMSAAVKSCPARVAEQWMIIVSLIAASSFLVGCGLCRWRIRKRWLRLPTVGGNIAGSPDVGPGCRGIV